MISLVKKESVTTDKSGTYVIGEFRAMADDDKPTEFDGMKVGNGSVLIEIDTQKIFFYDLDSETWKGE